MTVAVRKAETGNERLDRVLDFCLRPAVEYNLPQTKLWGALVDKNALMVASGHFLIDIRNLDLGNIEPGYFNYFESKFGELTYPIHPNQILEQVAVHDDFYAKASFPVTNFVRRLRSLDAANKLQKCRVVFTPGKIGKEDTLMRFVPEGSQMVFRHPKLEKPFVAGGEHIVGNMILPGQSYRTRITKEGVSAYEVDVLEPYGKIKAGILFSANGFIPNPEEKELIDHVAPEIYPPDMVITTNDAEFRGDAGSMRSVHLDAYMLYDLLKVFLLATDTCEILLPANPNEPVRICGTGGHNGPDITITVATLNPQKVGQMR